MGTHIIIVIMGAILCFIAINMRSKYKRLSSREKTTGTVADIEILKSKAGSIPTPVIHFTTVTQRVIIRSSADSLLSPRINKGTKVNVFYDPENPEDFIAQGLQFNMFTLTILISSIAFMAAGFILILNNDLKLIHLFK